MSGARFRRWPSNPSRIAYLFRVGFFDQAIAPRRAGWTVRDLVESDAFNIFATFALWGSVAVLIANY